MRRSILFILFAAILVSVLSSLPARAQSSSDNSDIVRILDQSGYKYTDEGDNTWNLKVSGKTFQSMDVKLLVVEDEVMVMYVVVDRDQFADTAEADHKMLELNHRFDFIKYGLSKQWLYIRIDQQRRLLDAQELKFMVTQLVNSFDESYDEIKPFITH